MGKFRLKREYSEAIAVYQNLSQGNISKAQVIRQAQLDFIQGKLTAKDITDRTWNKALSQGTTARRFPRPSLLPGTFHPDWQ